MITPDLIYQIISVVIIPFIIMLARQFKLPAKWAPVTAFVIAAILVGVGKLFGLDLNVDTIQQAILTALATAGISVLGYDTVKKLTEPK